MEFVSPLSYLSFPEMVVEDSIMYSFDNSYDNVRLKES